MSGKPGSALFLEIAKGEFGCSAAAALADKRIQVVVAGS